MPRDRHGDYFTYRPHWKVVKLRKIAVNYVNGSEGEYPPFRWDTAWFRVDVRPNGKWGEEVEGAGLESLRNTRS